MQDPCALLSHCAQKSTSFSRLLRRTREKTGDRPWTVVFYNDEVSPTNPKKKGTDNRKTEAFYWSFKEFGPRLLCNQRLWFVLTCVRSTLAHVVKSGMTSLFRTLLRTCFFSRNGHNLHTAGVHLTLPDGEVLHIRTQSRIILLADMPALKAAISSKGCSGAKPCCCCPINSKTSKLPGLTLTSTDFASMYQYTDDDVRHQFQRIVTEKERGNDVSKLETKLGWCYSDDPLIMDEEVFTGVASCVMFDWMHIFFCSGIVGVEVGLFMQFLWTVSRASKLPPIKYEHVAIYLKNWSWPRAHAHASNLLDGQNAKTFWEHGELGGSASEQLSFLPVFGRFVKSVVAITDLGRRCVDQIESLLALVAVVDLLYAIMHGGEIPADDLYQRIALYLIAFKKAYGTLSFRPKHHYALHLAQMLRLHGFLHSCWVHERRHQNVRRHCDNRKTLVGYEEGLVEALCFDNCYDLQDLDVWLDGGLVNPIYRVSKKMHRWLEKTFKFPAATDVYTANTVHVNGCHILRKDLAILHPAKLPDRELCASHKGFGFAQVFFHFRTTDGTYSCVSPWSVTEEGEGHVVLQMQDKPMLVESDALLSPVIFMRCNQSALALVPLVFR